MDLKMMIDSLSEIGLTDEQKRTARKLYDLGQNAELMQRTLTEINELKSFDEAMSYINSRFQWDSESNSYQQFVVSLHRRFG